MLIVLACACAVLGLGALALLIERHQEQWLRRVPRPATRRWLRRAGAVSLGASYALTAWDQGAALGSVLWLGLLTPCALLVAAVATAMGTRRARR